MHAGIVDDLTALVPRVLLVAGSEGKRGMDDIAIDGVDLQPPAARVKGRLDPLGAMIGVPELRGDEDVLPPNRSRPEQCLHRIADRFLIAVAFRAIEMPEACFQRGLRRFLGREGIGDQRAEPDGGDGAGSIVERDPRIAKRIGGAMLMLLIR